jgi:membrane-associated phospholipid phosphatase
MSKKTRRRTPFVVSTSLYVCLAAAAPAAQAQTTPKRLSDWLLEQPYTPNAYLPGLSWRVAGEVPAQHVLRQELLQYLAGADSKKTANTQDIARLRAWISSLPVTGRVPVSNADVRWLQANPVRDPVLMSGHTVVLPSRPATVTLIKGDGARCAVTHAAGHEASAYLAACKVTTADWAWIAQPDGRMQRFGVAAWNREVQSEPAPGAWIWAPARHLGWSDEFAEQLIAFLATQGPAPDPGSPAKLHAQTAAATPKQRPPSAAGGSAQGYRAGSETVDSSVQSVQREPPIANLPSAPAARSRSAGISAGDWGSVGLLQTPTARMYDAGHFIFSYGRVQPYLRGNIFFQPLDWLETGFRYTNVENRLYGPANFSGTQTYKDKSIDFKARLWPESAYLPQIAVGVRDAAGTGLYSGEFVVANKRTEMLDWSLGLGWGYLAGQARSNNFAQGGNFSIKNYFKGTPKPFGGVQYQTPLEKLTLKLEYDSNNYQNEPQANNQKRRSPWNFGLVYKAAKSVDITLGVERGNTLMLGIALHTQLDGLSTPKASDPPALPFNEARPQQPPKDWATTAQAIKAQTNWSVTSIEAGPRALRLDLDAGGATYWRAAVDKVAAVLHRDAPDAIDHFVLKYRVRGLEVAEHVIDRDAWVRPQTQPLPPQEQPSAVIARPPSKPEAQGNVLHTATKPGFTHNLRLGYGQTIGGPDAFVLFQVYAQESARLWLRDDTWIDGSLRLRLADNYGKFKQGANNGTLPRVRTFLKEYLTTARVTVPDLKITHVGQFTDNQYYSIYGGYLEEMFAGVGGEWLYRPFAGRLALGIDANVVKQRNFNQDLGFNKAGAQTGYRTATGHATLYWDTGWNDIRASLAVGRYLAGDSGATLTLARTFKNGVRMGAFATKTNVSAEQFGEGSFDKGIFLGIPFDALLTRTTGSVANVVWKPLTRDGGSLLSRTSLYGITGARDGRLLETKPPPLPNEALIPADHRESWTPKSAGPARDTRAAQKPSAAEFSSATARQERITEALYQQGYRNITLDYNQSNQLMVGLANDTIAPASHAVGRAARTILALAPLETREIKITFATRTDPAVSYAFFDLDRLNRYFSGSVSADELSNFVTVTYINPAARQTNPLERFDDLNPEAKVPIFSAVVPDTVSAKRVANDFANAGRTALDTNWMQMGVIGAGAILAGSAMDKRAFRFAQDHQNNRVIKNNAKVGNALPWIGLVGAGLVALDGSDPKRSRTGFAAAEAGASALLLSTGLKYAFGRSRPEDGLGTHHFNSFSAGNSNSSFPSRHASVAWAVATPFALEYDMPWLYVLPALTTLGRVGSREHWVSDAVAGSLLGYGLGRLFWESSRADNRYAPRVGVTRNGITLAWETP